MKIEKKGVPQIKKALAVLEKKGKPLFGNNRSFSCLATKRKWKTNKQKVKFGSTTYSLTPRLFRTISKQLKNKTAV